MRENKEDTLREFLSELTELSRKYKMGITGNPVLFILEKDDFERNYSCDAQSSLSFE